MLVVVGLFDGVVWMARRMVRYWPGSKQLDGDQRVTVVRAARSGEPVDDAGLARPVIEYGRALHAAAETGRWLRWVLVFVLAVGVGVAVWDFEFGTWGNAAASVIYLVAIVVELFLVPKWQAQLLSNAERAADKVLRSDPAD